MVESSGVVMVQYSCVVRVELSRVESSCDGRVYSCVGRVKLSRVEL